jgi:hypothetical protein
MAHSAKLFRDERPAAGGEIRRGEYFSSDRPVALELSVAAQRGVFDQRLLQLLADVAMAFA